MVLRIYSILIFICVGMVGCSSAPEETYPVEGTVTLDGKPLEGGSVLFLQTTSSESDKNYTARGKIDSEGHYELSTFGKNDGAVAGKFRVAVMSGYEPTGEAGGPPPPKKDVPGIYRNPDTSGLQFEVEPKTNKIDIPLVSRGRQ